VAIAALKESKSTPLITR